MKLAIDSTTPISNSKSGNMLMKMDIRQSDVFLRMETTCGSLLCELQETWDEVGEPEDERDNILKELEKECMEAYRRKVDQAYQCRAQMRQAIADAEAELAQIYSAMGERPAHVRQPDQKISSLKEELSIIMPHLEEMRKRKSDRKKQFVEVVDQIFEISNDIYRSSLDASFQGTADDDNDLSLKRLEDLHGQLHAHQKEKSDRLKQVLDHLNTLNSLSMLLGMDFKDQVNSVHPSLDDSRGTKNISDETIQKLSTAIQNLKAIKTQRLHRLQELASTMLELWNLMDTPFEEQHMFQNVTSKITASEDEITEPDFLSMAFVTYVETEVLRLERLKSSKVKDLVLKKRSELEEICRKARMVVEAQHAMQFSTETIESGAINPAYVLEQIELQISEAKEEAFSRKDILVKYERWLAACDEECWLEEYNRDENRYNAGRGAHLNLKHAERARTVVNKIPAMVETLTSKTKAWERERGFEFLYDGVPLLSMLEKYIILRQEKEQERQRQRDQRRLQGQLLAEQEVLYGSKPSPTKSGRKAPICSMGGAAANRRVSLSGGSLLHSSKQEKAALSSHPINKVGRGCPGNKNNAAPIEQQKKHAKTTKTRENDSLSSRKPLSPIPSIVVSITSPKNTPENTSRSPNMTPQKVFSGVKTTPRTTLTKVESVGTLNGRLTPVMITPSSMVSAMSGTPYTSTASGGGKGGEWNGDELECSFEEIRAGFAVPERSVKSALHF